MEELLQTLVKSIEGLQRIAEQEKGVVERMEVRIGILANRISSLDGRIGALEALSSNNEGNKL